MPNSEKRDQLIRLISVIAENKPHAHYGTHLYTMKVVTILVPSFHGLCEERLGHRLLISAHRQRKIEKRNGCIQESRSAKAGSTNNWFSIHTRSDLNKIREETIKKYDLIDGPNHAKV